MLRASDRSAELPAQLGHTMLAQALRADLGVQPVGRNLPPKSHTGVLNPSRAATSPGIRWMNDPAARRRDGAAGCAWQANFATWRSAAPRMRATCLCCLRFSRRQCLGCQTSCGSLPRSVAGLAKATRGASCSGSQRATSPWPSPAASRRATSLP